MKLQLLPPEESAKLRVLGFDWPCQYFFDGKRVRHISSDPEMSVNPEWGFNFNHRYSTDTNNPFPVSIPTLDLACKWFREAQDVHVVPDVTRDDTGDGKWYWTVVYVPSDLQDTESLHFCSWEEAQLHGIREAIEWLSWNLHKCLKCGGQGKPSKALLDEMERLCTEDALELGGHIEVPSGAVKMVNCTKCESCGHSWVENSRKNHNKNL